MRKMKVLVALVLAMTMVLSLSTAFAATVYAGNQTTTAATGTSVGSGPASIKVTLPTVPEGATAENTYKIYKVFNATTTTVGEGDAATNVISYTLVSGKTTVPAGFNLENGYVFYSGSNSELTTADIEAIKAYVSDSDIVATVKTVTADTSFTVSGLDYGYYFIDTTVGSAVTVDSTNPNAEVNDKNTVPGVDKKITGASSVDDDGKKALAQVGTVVRYQAEITIGKGAIGYVFHDKMEAGLAYNGDAAVTGLTEDVDYTVGKDSDDTFTITFVDSYIKNRSAGSKLVVTYSATVTENAITQDPLNNTCYVSYGDSNSNNRTPDSEADVYAAKITVTKEDDKHAPLAGAGFVIQDKNTGAYYKFVAAANTDDPATADVDESVDHIVWYTLPSGTTLKDAITAGNVTEYTSAADGTVAPFVGLANGTYTLIESTVPEGYNKAADIDFTIKAHDYTVNNLEQSATVTNNAGQELPSTGGIGTTIFYVAGIVLVLGAAAVMVARRKSEQ